MDIDELAIIETVEREEQNYPRILRRQLRDVEDPFGISDQHFIKLFRLPKHLTFQLIEELKEYIYESRYSNGIPIHVKVLSALRFFATGSYQTCIGQNALVALSQTCISNNIYEVSLAMNYLTKKYIKFPKSNEERTAIKHKYKLFSNICFLILY